PEMATVRPGMLHAARPDAGRGVVVEALTVLARAPRVRVVRTTPVADAVASLDTAHVVLGVGKGLGKDGVAAVAEIAGRLGAGLAAAPEVTAPGWVPRHAQ